jgi:hypothetical protein
VESLKFLELHISNGRDVADLELGRKENSGFVD